MAQSHRQRNLHRNLRLPHPRFAVDFPSPDLLLLDTQSFSWSPECCPLVKMPPAPVLTRSELLVTSWGSLVFPSACGLCQSGPPSPAPEEWGEGFSSLCLQAGCVLPHAVARCLLCALQPWGAEKAARGTGLSVWAQVLPHLGVHPSSNPPPMSVCFLLGPRLHFQAPCGISAEHLSPWTGLRS